MSALAAACVLAAVIALASCAPGGVPVPPQRRSYNGPERKPFPEFVRMSDPHAYASIVSGVRPEGRWAWTSRRAELRFWLPDSRPRKFALDFFLARQTLRETGPVGIAVSIDGQRLGVFRADAAREFTFEKPVPEGWVGPDAPVSVTLEADRALRGTDGTEYAFLLVSAGFLPR